MTTTEQAPTRPPIKHYPRPGADLVTLVAEALAQAGAGHRYYYEVDLTYSELSGGIWYTSVECYGVIRLDLHLQAA